MKRGRKKLIEIKDKPCSHHKMDSSAHGGPMGYIQWHEYARKKNNKGVHQAQCPTCGYWLFSEEFGRFKTYDEIEAAGYNTGYPKENGKYNVVLLMDDGTSDNSGMDAEPMVDTYINGYWQNGAQFVIGWKNMDKKEKEKISRQASQSPQPVPVMTVGELIRQLRRHPDHTPVYQTNGEHKPLRQIIGAKLHIEEMFIFIEGGEIMDKLPPAMTRDSGVPVAPRRKRSKKSQPGDTIRCPNKNCTDGEVEDNGPKACPTCGGNGFVDVGNNNETFVIKDTPSDKGQHGNNYCEHADCDCYFKKPCTVYAGEGCPTSTTCTDGCARVKGEQKIAST